MHVQTVRMTDVIGHTAQFLIEFHSQIQFQNSAAQTSWFAWAIVCDSIDDDSDHLGSKRHCSISDKLLASLNFRLPPHTEIYVYQGEDWDRGW